MLIQAKQAAAIIRPPNSVAALIGPAGILVAGAVLALACGFMPARLPALAPWDFSWAEYLACAFGLWFYVLGLLRTRRTARPSLRRRLCFLGGTLLIYAVLQTRFDYLAQHMFTLTRVQHLVTHHLGPFLIALAWPGEILRVGMPRVLRRAATSRPVRAALAMLQTPVIAGVLFVGLIFVWLIPPVLFRAMIDQRLYAVMNWSMVLDGLLFWCLVLDPRAAPPARPSRGIRLLLIFAVQWPQIAGGALIGFAEGTLYPYYTLCGRLYPAVSAGTDQQIGGFIIWFGGGMMSAVAAIVVLRALGSEEREADIAVRAGS